MRRWYHDTHPANLASQGKADPMTTESIRQGLFLSCWQFDHVSHYYQESYVALIHNILDMQACSALRLWLWLPAVLNLLSSPCVLYLCSLALYLLPV